MLNCLFPVASPLSSTALCFRSSWGNSLNLMPWGAGSGCEEGFPQRRLLAVILLFYFIAFFQLVLERERGTWICVLPVHTFIG